MKHLTLILTIMISSLTYGQFLPVIEPKISDAVNYTKAEQVYWEKAMELLSKVNSGEMSYGEQMSKKDIQAIDSLEMMYGPMTEGVGCSWYCGGGPYKITASSYLQEQGKNTYLPNNIHDFDLLTAWVPKGTIGMKINFHFKPFTPRVNEILLWNGYIKNIDLWKANSRVAKFKLYVNGEPKAILNLIDSTNAQSFKINPVQSTDSIKDMILTLEILEIYNGTKYSDVAISEVNFDGLDVHCFAKGTIISLANGKTKEIQDIQSSDSILSFDFKTEKLTVVTNARLVTARHSNLIKLRFKDREITVTDDHPFWTYKKKWASINPDKSNLNYIQEEPVKMLSEGDKIFVPSDNSFLEIIDIDQIQKEQLTYTLEFENGESFIANGLLVKTEKVELIFNKKFIDSEDKWVAFQKDRDNKYGFGFIYIDEEAGLTLNHEGSFTISNNGDFISKKLDSVSIKVRLQNNQVKVAWIPKEKLEQLNVLKTPNWLKYYKNDINSIKRLYAWGYKYNSWNKCSKALTYLEKAYKINPEYKNLGVELAYSYNCLNKYKKAILIMEKVVKLNPKDSYSNKELIYAQIKSRKLKSAEKSIKKAIKKTDGKYNGENIYNLLYTYYKMNDKKKVLNWIDKAKKWNSKNKDLMNNIDQIEKDINK